ncbi:MAG: biopolymer transporter ExbD [Planctomycetaceae bacterium]|nr:biopolymer transporter ExbD [Planctomycetaceae bacterium]MCP4462599.1 biopolymer transporter ExbD [Planctomycetaceae bacterium]MDG1807174.1 biopolymer transporter ExbD [Pirellulaceae bacterium]MDG2104960.1 biopolymer transporter ExbD [Pirellulaceae bacterium]
MEERQEPKIAIKQRTKRAGDGDLDITPMIDITFLLLAFFVVVSKMDPTTIVNMPKAKYGDSVPEQTAVILVVEATDEDAPVVYKGKSKNDSAKCTGQIEDIETQLSDFVKDEMANNPLKTSVIIKAEKKVKYRHLDIVKRAVSGVLTEENVIHIGIEEE